MSFTGLDKLSELGLSPLKVSSTEVYSPFFSSWTSSVVGIVSPLPQATETEFRPAPHGQHFTLIGVPDFRTILVSESPDKPL